MKKLMTAAFVFVAAFLVSVAVVVTVKLVNKFVAEAQLKVRDYFAGYLQAERPPASAVRQTGTIVCSNKGLTINLEQLIVKAGVGNSHLPKAKRACKNLQACRYSGSADRTTCSSGFFVKPEMLHGLSMFLKSRKLSKKAFEPPPAIFEPSCPAIFEPS